MSEPLDFATTDEGLFGPGNPINTDIIPIDLHSTQVGPVTEGQIAHIDQDVPVSILQAAWQQAIDTCTGQSFSRQVHSSCANASITPTQAECETGHIGTRTVSVTCCVSPTDAWSNGCFDIPFAPDTTTRTYTRTLDIDLGAGIGPRPTQPTPTPMDVGAIVTYEADVDIGLEFEIEQDAGSVDVAYGTVATLQASADEVAPGDVFTLTAFHTPDPDLIHLSSEYPSIEFIFRYFIDANAVLDAEYAHMGPDGKQVRVNRRLIDFHTADQANADAQGRIVGEFIGVEVGVGGAEVRFMDNVPYAPEFTQDRVWQFPLAFSWDITSPFTCPQVPLLSGALCGPPPQVSTDLFEIGVRTPAVNTPAKDPFDGGVDGFLGDPLEAKRNEIGADGSVTNTTPSGWRPLVAGLLGDLSDIDLNDILIDDGYIDTDMGRLDVDVDGLLALAFGVPNPVGVNFVALPQGPDPATGVTAPPLILEANGIDLDLVNFFHIDQALKFEPNLVADLAFSKPVQVREDDSSPWSSSVTSWPLPVYADRTSQLEILQPPGGVEITPTYSLRHNLFTNDTRWLYTFAAQETWLQLKIEGFLVAFLTNALGGFDPNFALFQETVSPGPLEMSTSGSTAYALDGLADIPGQSLVIAATFPGDFDADSDVDGSDAGKLALNPGLLSLSVFASNFGRTE